MKIKATPNIHDDDNAEYLIGSYSGRHYGYHCEGHPHDYCIKTAREMAARMMEANATEGCSHYGVIDLAIIPYPNKPGYYFIEDRSLQV